MAKKMLGKVVAGAALGGASLLVFAPGVAFADGQPHENEGKVFAKPHAAKPGEEIKLVEICEKPQENAFVWSKVTGKVKLEPARDGGKWDRGGWNGEDGSYEHGKDGKDWPGREHEKDGKDWQRGEDSGDWKSGEDSGEWHGGEDGKDWKGGEDRGGDWKSGEEGGEWQGREDAPQAGAGGGAAADEERDWKSDEHGQDAEDGRDWKGREDDKHGEKSESDWKDRGEHGKGDGWEHEKDFVYYGEARIARDAKPGTYKLEGSCGEGELVVLPHGGVDGGDGGLTAGTDRSMATAGAGLVGAAALGGLVLLRRRRTDEFAA
ncbi:MULTISPECIES: hypothetical protein [Micromonospora]|uniref:hypothetical protein n=1 Tax=Micromonospora TaxID=1873 RepID=UPI000C87E0D5|nr:hypothetical protein [Verrucosispora sp. ts21]PMR60162.1 hypothetical protein C1A38_15870 [Verrucosispora sp. ts21]